MLAQTPVGLSCPLVVSIMDTNSSWCLPRNWNTCVTFKLPGALFWQRNWYKEKPCTVQKNWKSIQIIKLKDLLECRARNYMYRSLCGDREDVNATSLLPPHDWRNIDILTYLRMTLHLHICGWHRRLLCSCWSKIQHLTMKVTSSNNPNGFYNTLQRQQRCTHYSTAENFC